MVQGRSLNFFILSLPRSRSKWWGHYYAAYDVQCHHELSTNSASIEEFQQAMSDNCGDADWNLGNTNFQELYPEAPIAILLRDPEDVTRSLMKSVGWPYALTYNTFLSHYETLEKMEGDNIKHFYFEDINKDIEEIHNWLTPDVTFNAELSASLLEDKIHEDMISYDQYKVERSIRMWKAFNTERYDDNGRIRR